MRSTTLRIMLLATTSLGLASASPAQTVAGHVQSVQGNVTARGPNGAVRSLGCGDPVFAGDTLVTESGGRVGVLMGETLASLAPKSSLRVGLTDASTPDTELEAGRVRIIDAREEGAAGRLAVTDIAGEIAGNDVEAYRFAEKAGGYAMLCEWDDPLAVARDDDRIVANPGECVVGKPGEPLYKAKGHDQRIAATGSGACPASTRGLASANPHFPPTALPAVAAGPPPPTWSNLPGPLAGVNINPCDDPGAICATGTSGLVIVSEPPTVSIPTPGAGGTFPGSP